MKEGGYEPSAASKGFAPGDIETLIDELASLAATIQYSNLQNS